MPARAACPACTRSLPRSGYFGSPTRPEPCPYCGTAIRKDPKWEWTGNLILGTALAAFAFLGLAAGMALFRISPVLAGLAVIAPWAVMLLLGWFIYPWVTRFTLVEAGARCEICGYDLRATPARCPECGTPAGRRTP